MKAPNPSFWSIPMHPRWTRPCGGGGRSAISTARRASRAPKEPTLLFVTLYQIVDYLINIIVFVVIVQFVLGLLIAFNVVNMHNQFVSAVYTALNAILEPMLRPIRKIMPNTGAIDFSPMVLIIGLTILQIILGNLARAYY
jgi:YggT family protein